MFADDTCLFSQNKDLLIACNKLQAGINELEPWFEHWKLRLNPLKSEMKIFTFCKISPTPGILIDNTVVPWNTSTVKYLGIHLDQKLSLKNLIVLKSHDAYLKLRKLYPLLNHRSRLSTSCSLLLYKSLIHSSFTYAAPIWITASKTNKYKIQIIQNKVLQIITNAPWFLRNNQLHNELQIESIDAFSERLTEKYLFTLELLDDFKFLLSKNLMNLLKTHKNPQDLF